MLTFSLTPKSGLRIVGGQRTLSVFPTTPVSGDVSLMAGPEEEMLTDVISWPGEYDIAGITIRGIGQEDGQQVSFMCEIDGLRCAFPSSPLKVWESTDIERLGDIHILVLQGDQDPKISQKLLEDIDPRLLMIVPGEGDKIDPELLKSTGAVGKEQVGEYKVKGGFAAEGREVVVFGR